MSRIGSKPVAIIDGVEVIIAGQDVSAKGPKGSLTATMPSEVSIVIEGKEVVVKPLNNGKRARAMWGLSRSLIANLIEGTSKGYSKKLEINGVGYRAKMQGSKLELSLGFSHPVIFEIPEGIKVEVPTPTELVISGADKQLVGEFAALIRKKRPPEPYKGKGVKYEGEYIFRKEGKKK